MPILGVIASGISGHLTPPWPTNSYYQIATTTVGSGGSSGITFSSIPSTYTHLQVRGIWSHSTTNVAAVIRFNSLSTSYTQHLITGNGSVISAGSNTTGDGITGVGCTIASNSNAGAWGCSVIDILDYKNTNKYKTVRVLNGQDANGAGVIRMYSGMWVNTSAISTIQIIPNGGTFNEYTSFAVYGIMVS